jgi:hypothetical protein
MQENGVSLNFEKAHFSYVKEGKNSCFISWQELWKLDAVIDVQRIPISLPSPTQVNILLSSQLTGTFVSLSEMRDLQSFSLLQSKLTGKCDEVDFRVEASGRADKASNVLTPRRCMQPVLQ